MTKRKKVKVRRVWAIKPVTRIIADKRHSLYRKRKHKGRCEP